MLGPQRTIRMHPGLAGFTRSLLNLVLPQTCIGCGVWICNQSSLCDECERAFRELRSASYCVRCGRAMPRVSIFEKHCAQCSSERHWNVAAVARIGTYSGPLRASIIRLKYHGRQRDADWLGEQLAAELGTKRWIADVDAVIPVPMHRLRRFQRPCNHAQEIAEACVRSLRRIRRDVRRIRVASLVVCRGKHAPSQTEMQSRSARFENVRDCFSPSWRAGRIAGKTVCIVDNLLVSGATLHEVSRVLRRAGARTIYAAVAARALPAGEAQRILPDAGESISDTEE